MTIAQSIDRTSIQDAVQAMYNDVANQPGKEFHFPTGRTSCLYLGYPEEVLNAAPAPAVESFAGVGYPFLANVIREGDVVADIGSGSGTDLIIAAQKTGPDGQAYGIDMTKAMIEKARENIKEARLEHALVAEGRADEIPLRDASVDVATSNGVINLVPDKKKAFSELFRILKSGGRIQIADIVLSKRVSEKSKSNPQLWAECIVGAEPADDYLALLRDAGFQKVAVIDRLDYFAHSPNQSTKKAANDLGAYAIVLTAEKPA